MNEISVAEKVSRYFGLSYESNMQDWELELADSERVEEFIGSYNTFQENREREAVLKLIIASYDDYRRAVAENSVVEASLSNIILDDWEIHAETVQYWALLDFPEAEGEFAVTPMMRNLWKLKQV